MSKAIYAFSGDPITNGHLDIIRRAAKAFSHVTIGIGINPEKNYMFSLEERVDMAARCTFNIPNVKVASFQGMLVDYAYEQGIPFIIKGVRNAVDADYEQNLDQLGKSQRLGVDTFILYTKPKYAHISSSAVKSIQKEQGLIHEYVPLYVKQLLEAKISGQYIVGITGELGCGKSFLSKEFCRIGKKKGIEVHKLELDVIGNQILTRLTEPAYLSARNQIAACFDLQTKSKDKFLNRKELGEIVFKDKKNLNRYMQLMQTAILVRLRREMYGKKGLIIFNAALIAESNMLHLCNNHVLLVKASKESQYHRLKQRNLSEDQIERRLSSQYTTEQKKQYILRAIEKDNQGSLWELDNSGTITENQIESLFDTIFSTLHTTSGI